MIMLPVVLIIMLITAVSSCSMQSYRYPEGYDASVNVDRYDEEMLQDYADKQYAKAFGSLSTYEDNLLLVVVTEEDNSNYSWIAWVGDHIATDINLLFGNEETVLGEVLGECINESNYKYSLDSNLADAMRMMATEIKHLELESSYHCTETRTEFESHVVNDTALPLTEQTVNDALAYFTETTGIPAVIVIADSETVFPEESVQQTQEPEKWSVVNIALVIGVVLLAVMIIVTVLNRKKNQDVETAESAQRNKRYSEFDDQYK